MNEIAPPEPAPPAHEPPPGTRPPGAKARERDFSGLAEALFDDGMARANWAVPWSDLMMTMFVLLVALFAAHQLQQGGRHRDPVSTKAALPVLGEVEVKEEVIKRSTLLEPPVRINVLARSEQAVREANLKNAEIVLMDDESVKVSVQGPMFFALGRADLRPEVTDFLKRLAQVIKETPYEIHVVGHTDDLPIRTAQFPSNWELSLVRASHVARYLIDAGGIDPARFVVMGRGQYEPVAQNEDPRSRALNRRVEIIITRTVHPGEGGGRS
jgi:chemotaxis protein MotB